MATFSTIIFVSTLLSYKANAQNCEIRTLESSDISIWALPDGIDTSNRNLFHDPDTMSIDTLEFEICKDKEGNIYTTITMKGTGLALTVPTTIWQLFGPDPSTQPIFEYVDPFIPLSSTTAAFTNGRNPFNEPNTIQIENNHGSFNYEYKLDYNPFKTYQAPLSNAISSVVQSEFCNIGDINGIDANLCQNEYRSSGLYTSIGKEFLREFNQDGTQKVDISGNAVVVRSPLAVTTWCVVTHSFDMLTHGIEDGTVTHTPVGNCEPVDECSDYYIVSCFGLPEEGNDGSDGNDNDIDNDSDSDSGDAARINKDISDNDRFMDKGNES
eukprot:83845_1